MARLRRNKNKSQKKDNKSDAGFREKLVEALELPKEILLDMTKLTMLGNNNLVIENYKGIVEYENDRIRINTAKGLIRIQGEDLKIKEITSEDIMISGRIGSLEFLE